MKQNKRRLRNTMRAHRRALSKRQQLRAAQLLSKTFCNHSALLRARHVACYLPFDGEIDTGPIIAELLRRKKKVYLPVLTDRRLRFMRYDLTTALRRNRYKIQEPQAHRGFRKPWALQLILLPLVAFDERGQRLGMGAGFYDRTLAFVRYLPKLRRPVLIGLAHQFQQVAELKAEEWDVELDWIVTDGSILHCRPLNRA